MLNSLLSRYSRLTSLSQPIVLVSTFVALGGCASVVPPGGSYLSAAPSTMPQHVPLPQRPRPYLTFQPKMPPPARYLYVAEIGKLPLDQQRLLVTLQGIVNRTQPRIYRCCP